MEFHVFNGGEAEAEGLQLTACFPKEFNVIPSGTWKRVAVVKHNMTEGINYLDDRAFMIPSDVSALMPPHDMATFVPLTLQCSNLHNSVNFLSLSAIAKHNVKQEISYMIHITNGVGRPYIGF